VPGMLAAMLDDPDEIVRELVLKRVAAQENPEFGGNVLPFNSGHNRNPGRR